MTAVEKIYYGLMMLAIVVGVLASPFFYARSLKFLHQRWEKQRKKYDLPSPVKNDDSLDETDK